MKLGCTICFFVTVPYWRHDLGTNLEGQQETEQDCIKNHEQRVEATTFFFFLLFAATFIWNLLR